MCQIEQFADCYISGVAIAVGRITSIHRGPPGWRMKTDLKNNTVFSDYSHILLCDTIYISMNLGVDVTAGYSRGVPTQESNP